MLQLKEIVLPFAEAWLQLIKSRGKVYKYA